MRKLLPLLAIILFSSCSSTKKSQSVSTSNITSSSSTTSLESSAEKNGSSYENAIVIKAKSESTGVAAEYKWLKENYPGYTMISQSLDHKDKRHYDILNIKTKDGETKSIYFDITNFFGKW